MLFGRLTVTRLEGRDNPAPTISNFSGQQIGSSWVVTGQVIDINPGQDTVAITGAASGAATVYDDGWFDFVTANSGSGTVTARATDANGNQSDTSSATITAPDGKASPHLTLAVSYNQQRSVTLTGKVIDDIPVGGLTVSFSGQVTGTVTTGSDGTFSYTACAAGLGTVSASLIDSLNVASNVPVIRLTSKPPTITLNGLMVGGTAWKFTGAVTDESPANLTVTFGGDLAGATVTTSGGSYVFFANIPYGEHGTITAQTTDWWGQESNVAVYTF